MAFGGFEESRRSLVAWTEELQTGVEVLDQQHLRYIELLYDCLGKAAQYTNTEQKTRQLLESFEFLRGYADEHFAAEDSIMVETAYPKFAKDREEHQRFTTHVEQLAQRMENGGFSAGLSREVDFYAIEWFIDHILDSDMKLARFLKDCNLAERAADYVSG